jgi:hypothetical protein
MRTLPIAAALLLAAVLLAGCCQPCAAQEERTVTCDGAYRGERIGYCHLMDHLLLEKGGPAPVGLEKINQAGCEMYERCVIRARVIPSANVDGYQNWTVLMVYSARKR